MCALVVPMMIAIVVAGMLLLKAAKLFMSGLLASTRPLFSREKLTAEQPLVERPRKALVYGSAYTLAASLIGVAITVLFFTVPPCEKNIQTVLSVTAIFTTPGSSCACGGVPAVDSSEH